MSAAFADVTEIGASITRDDANVLMRFEDRLVVGRAAAARRLVTDELDRLPTHRSAIIDLGEVDELDAAGLAAVTAPSFAALRRGCRVAVLPPTSGPARRFAETVGVLPIGVG